MPSLVSVGRGVGAGDEALCRWLVMMMFLLSFCVCVCLWRRDLRHLSVFLRKYINITFSIPKDVLAPLCTFVFAQLGFSPI